MGKVFSILPNVDVYSIKKLIYIQTDLVSLNLNQSELLIITTLMWGWRALLGLVLMILIVVTTPEITTQSVVAGFL